MVQRLFVAYERFDGEMFNDYGKMRDDNREADESNRREPSPTRGREQERETCGLATALV
jgi:hypothetical protein